MIPWINLRPEGTMRSPRRLSGEGFLKGIIPYKQVRLRAPFRMSGVRIPAPFSGSRVNVCCKNDQH